MLLVVVGVRRRPSWPRVCACLRRYCTTIQTACGTCYIWTASTCWHTACACVYGARRQPPRQQRTRQRQRVSLRALVVVVSVQVVVSVVLIVAVAELPAEKAAAARWRVRRWTSKCSNWCSI